MHWLFVENARINLENKPKRSIGLFLDLKKPFDSLSLHSKKISHISLRRPELTIMESFLCERKQSLRNGSQRTSASAVSFDVPQGSVLGPLLFIIYFNNIKKNCNLILTLQADDTALQHEKKNICDNMLLDDINKLNQFLSDNKLTLSFEKSIILLPMSSRNASIKLTIGNDMLKQLVLS